MTDAASTYSDADRQTLLKLARDAVRIGVEQNSPPKVHLEHFPEHLKLQRACFVTLKIAGQLRGCIGSLQATRPLADDVAQNAYAAGFRDPRFQPVGAHEYDQLEYHISVLSEPEPMTFTDEADLLSQIRPNVDGLILSDQGRRGTFLPSVWEQLPNKVDFLNRLKQKAGLPMDHWSDTVRVERYTAESIE